MATAAILKGVALARVLSETALLAEHGFVVGLLVSELLLAGWLLTSYRPFALWIVTISVFAMFSSFALFRAVRGDADCGCFGLVQISPWIVFTVDVLVLSALLSVAPRGSSDHPIPPQRWNLTAPQSVAILCIVMLWSSSLVLGASGFNLSLTRGAAFDSREQIALHPDTWVGSPLAILEMVGHSEPLHSGKWTVLFVRADCPACHYLLNKIRNLNEAPRGSKLAIIELPPGSHRPHSGIEWALWLRLTDEKRWFASTPFVLALDSGIVRQHFSAQRASDAFLDGNAKTGDAR